MGFLTLLALWAGSILLYIIFRPKIESDSDPGDFRPPEPREGEPIPVIWGTVLTSPSVTWFGDVHASETTKEVSQLFGLIKDDVPTGFEYLSGMQLVLCHGPVDELLDIFIGEKRLFWSKKFVGTGQSTEPPAGWPDLTSPDLPIPIDENGVPTRVSINAPALMGGPEEGGGIVGQFDMHWGTLIQGPNDYLAAFWGADILPHYRQITYAVLRRMNVGKSPSPPPWKFVLKRIPSVLSQDEYATITDEDANEIANAAEVIYELMVDDVWGLARKAEDIDIATFQAVGQTLFNEGLGYSGSMFKQVEAYSVIQTILRHVDGVVYQDPLSGLIAIKLIRDDYSVPSLVELDETNSVIEEFTRGSWAEAVNETQITFTDIARRFSDAAAQAQNLAAIQSNGGEVISTKINLKGLSTHEQAQLAAERINRVTSVPLNRYRIRTNRIAYGFHPGMPFKVTNADYGVSEMVCRVVSVDYGSLVEGEMTVEAIQDAFDISNRAYASPDDLVDLEPCGPLALIVEGYDPAGDPGAVYGARGYQTLFEAPYWHNTTGGRVWFGLSRRSNSDHYYELYRSIHGAPRVKMSEPQDFIAVGLLDADMEQTGIDFTSVAFTIQSAGDMEDLTSSTFAGMLAGDRLLMIGDEILSWESIENLGAGQYRISGAWRGQLDTVPNFHTQSTPVFFYWNSSGAGSALDLTSPDDLDGFTSIQVQAAIVNADGTSDNVDQVAITSLVMGERVDAPLPPGNVQIDGLGYDAWPVSTAGDVTLSWAHRSRTEQTQMVAQDDSQNFTQQGTLTIEVLLDGISVREWTGVTATSQAYTYAQREADDADASKKVEFRITPLGAGSEEGTIRITPSFIMGA